jgi:hypothetical protein
VWLLGTVHTSLGPTTLRNSCADLSHTFFSSPNLFFCLFLSSDVLLVVAQI